MHVNVCLLKSIYFVLMSLYFPTLQHILCVKMPKEETLLISSCYSLIATGSADSPGVVTINCSNMSGLVRILDT